MELTFEHSQKVADGHNPAGFHYADNYIKVSYDNGLGAIETVRADTPMGDFDSLIFGAPGDGIQNTVDDIDPAHMKAYSYSGREHWIVWVSEHNDPAEEHHRIAKYKFHLAEGAGSGIGELSATAMLVVNLDMGSNVGGVGTAFVDPMCIVFAEPTTGIGAGTLEANPYCIAIVGPTSGSGVGELSIDALCLVTLGQIVGSGVGLSVVDGSVVVNASVDGSGVGYGLIGEPYMFGPLIKPKAKGAPYRWAPVDSLRCRNDGSRKRNDG